MSPMRIAALVVAAVALLLILDSAWAAFTIDRGLNDARNALQAGADDLRDGRVEDAAASFATAQTAADRASSATQHPAVLMGKALPLIGDDVEAVDSLVDVASLSAQAGTALTSAAEASGLGGSGSLLDEGGKVRLDALQSAHQGFMDADALLRKADGIIRAVPLDNLVDPVREPVETARTTLAKLTSTTSKAVTISGLLPGLLGADGQRRYLLVLMSLADPRGSGGYPGQYGILSATDGQLRMTHLTPMGNLGFVPPVSSLRKPQARYLRFGGNTHFIASTYSPDFPTTARTILALWNAKGEKPVDGVIATDSVWIADLLTAIGPVDAPGRQDPITSANASDAIIKEPYMTLSQTKEDRVQTELGNAIFSAFLSRRPEPVPFAEAMTKAVAERHFQFYSTDPAEESTLASLDSNGAYKLGDNPLAVVWQGASPARSGYFAEKAIHYKATVNDDGSVDVVTEIRALNGAPDGPASILLGDGKDYPIGYWGVYVNLYLPTNATKVTSEVIGGPGLQLFESEFGHPVVLQYLGTNSGQSQTARITYTIPAKESAAHGFRVDITTQPALRPEHVSIEINTPGGTTAHSSSAGVVVNGQSAVWEGTPTRPTTISVSY